MKYRDRIVGLVRIRGDRILPNPLNWRTHGEEQRAAIRGVLGDIGVGAALIAVPADDAALKEVVALKGADRDAWAKAFERGTGDVLLLDGHLRAEEIRDQPIAVLLLDLSPAEQAEFLATFDPIGALAGRNAAKLDETLRAFNSTNADVQALVAKIRADGEAALDAFNGQGGDGAGQASEGGEGTGGGHDGDAGASGGGAGSLAERFGVPPFSVLNAREGWWQARKAAWIARGVIGELGRGHALDDGSTSGRAFGQDLMHGEHVVGGGKGKASGALGFSESARRLAGGYENGDGGVKQASGTSVFDPVLCELVYRWFCLPGGSVLDPFAGEATKGLIAGALGYQYTGVELRSEQVSVNRELAQAMGVSPTWVCADSAALDKALPGGALYDFVWTSPPYYDLEIYSKSEKDGSAFETYDKFIAWYKTIFAQAVARLRANRFLAVKVGEVRDKKTGAYYNFVGDNIRVFRELGLTYYNEMILVTAVGSLPIRVGKQFQGSRKVGKTHQNVLVFWKGDPRKVADNFRDVGRGLWMGIDARLMVLASGKARHAARKEILA